MSENRIVGPNTNAVDRDLDDEPIVLPEGTVPDENAAERFGRAVADRAAALGEPVVARP